MIVLAVSFTLSMRGESSIGFGAKPQAVVPKWLYKASQGREPVIGKMSVFQEKSVQ